MRRRMHPAWWAVGLSFVVLGGLAAVLFMQQTTATTSGTPLKVYVAAGIRAPVEKLAASYEQEYGQPIELTFDGSNTLLSSIRVAPVGDLYLPGDDSYLNVAREEDLVAEILPIAQMHGVVLVGVGNPKNIRTFDDLLRDDVKLGQANPNAAAIGKLTREVLSKTDQWDALVENTTVTTGTVTEAANQVKVGSLDAAIIWDAITPNYPDQEVVRLSELEPVVARVQLGVLTASQQPTAALRFARYVASREKGLPVFAENGFPDTVQGDAWAITPELTIFSGSMLRPAIEKTLEEFEEREGVKISTNYNGCGILVGQMKTGIRPDAYFACDTSFMDEVVDLAFFADPSDVSGNQMIIAVPKDNPHGIQRLADLTKPGLKVGVGHEEQCALGALTRDTLKEAGVYQPIRANVQVESPAADFLVNQLLTESLDAVICYRSTIAYQRNKLIGIPIEGIATAYPTQPFAIGTQTKYPYLTARLFTTLQTATSQERFEQVGFTWKRDGTPTSLEQAD